jgi:hypothetical protein
MRQQEFESGDEELLQKTRRDKGVVLYSPRDEYCLGWIADQYAARLDQIQRLLSRHPGGKVKNQARGLAPTTVKDQIERWRRAGWIEYQRVLVNQPGWAWITRKGLQVLDFDDFYTARAPAYSRLGHIYAVNQVRMAEEMRTGLTWKSERKYRSELESVEKGESTGPIPDGIITEKAGAIAVEVELTQKKPKDLAKKLEELTSCFGKDDRLKFPRIWIYVPDEKGKQAVERARQDLIEEDQKRVEVAVFAGLIA